VDAAQRAADTQANAILDDLRAIVARLENAMTDKTRKDRQSRARERVKRAGGHRITVAISSRALTALGKLCKADDVSQSAVVSTALELAGEHAGIFSGDAPDVLCDVARALEQMR
jgi:poly-gamma-glutamate capsule biosynthesis protein CapA/YwtB (metallophosphatase superfamily)